MKENIRKGAMQFIDSLNHERFYFMGRNFLESKKAYNMHGYIHEI